MARRYPLRMETRVLGGVQIILAVFHCALALLCDCLFNREVATKSTGHIPVLLTLGYIYWSSPFFVISGSMSVSAQKKPTRYKLTSTIVMSIFSACFSAFGTIILCIAFFSYTAEMKEYVWSDLAGATLLQYLLFSTLTELIIVSLILSWIVRALHHPEETDEEIWDLQRPSEGEDFTGDFREYFWMKE
ncbi:membrane-spanning 4-domains subfamily A member 12 [Hippopotamus amphibius kiboko]|uniref:membrane-spanning 4-domains subfamily A member 12 n=1 Tax=Hippopotamus amphibius kiboko TaxID=575201 RepID=UPI0025939E36|nr:membrane-spanning 4-domains subfamily A member 12 [Hippopotamus amphibius kiboko]